MAKPSRALIAQRKKELAPLAEKHPPLRGLINGIAKRSNVGKSVERVNQLIRARVPLRGVIYKLSLSDADFQNLLLRHKGKGGLNTGQQALFDLMVTQKGVSREIAMSIAKRKTYHQMKIPEKIAYFEGIKLDPKVYGVERIPVGYYSHLLTKPFEEIQRGIQRQVLWKLEDDFAAKKLDTHLPRWREVGAFYGNRTGKRKLILRPSRIIRQIILLEQKGIPLRIDNILASFEWAANNPRIKEASASPYKKILRDSKLDRTKKGMKRQRKALEERLAPLETQISQINNRLAELNEKVRTNALSRVDAEIERGILAASRTELVNERNKLLVKS